MNDEEILTEINKVWGNANFGTMGKIEVVSLGLLKCASGYHQGHTSKSILEDLDLIRKSYELTAKGRCWLWYFFSNNSNF
jgi:hypothetical protein